MTSTFKESLRQASKGVLCSVLAVEDNLTSWLGSLPVAGNGFSNENLFPARKVRQYFCDNPDPVEGEPPPFTGGQCPGVLYQVAVSGERKFNNGFVNPYSATLTNVTGPILFVGREDTDTQARVVVKGSPPSGTTPVVSENLSSIESISINTVITRMDGAPDNCGSPPAPPIPPYIPVTTNIDITYVDNTEIEITEGAEFTLLAPVFIGGAIIAPVRVDVGGVEFPLNFNLETGEITLDFSRDFIESPAPVVEPPPPPNPTGDEPEVEENELIYGLIVYSVPSGTSPVTTLVDQSGAPSLRLPRTGNVYFQVPVGDRVSWEGPIPVQMENQLVMVPSGLGATGYRVVPNTGWELEVVRVGRPPC